MRVFNKYLRFLVYFVIDFLNTTLLGFSIIGGTSRDDISIQFSPQKISLNHFYHGNLSIHLLHMYTAPMDYSLAFVDF